MTGKSEVSFPVADHPGVDQPGQFICVCKLKSSIDLPGDSLCSRSHWYREKVTISYGLSYRRLGRYPETVFDALDSRTLFAKPSQRFSACLRKAIHRPARARRALPAVWAFSSLLVDFAT